MKTSDVTHHLCASVMDPCRCESMRNVCKQTKTRVCQPRAIRFGALSNNYMARSLAIAAFQSLKNLWIDEIHWDSNKQDSIINCNSKVRAAQVDMIPRMTLIWSKARVWQLYSTIHNHCFGSNGLRGTCMILSKVHDFNICYYCPLGKPWVSHLT